MTFDEQAATEGLSILLRAWNGDETLLTPTSISGLVHLAVLELGAPEATAALEVTDVEGLSRHLRPLLPTNDQGQTMADIFVELRNRAARELKIPAEAIGWGTSWASLDSTRPMALWDSGDFLEVVLTECKATLDEPWELVGETVRCIWKARGGHPFWHLPPYEHNWCASQGVFYDVRQVPMLQRAEVGRIEPSTPLSSLISKKKHVVLLGTIESRFGVWLGRHEKEGCLPLLIAGILASPLSMMVGACLAVAFTGTGSNVGAVFLFSFYGVCITVAAMIYVRSQPRLPFAVRTVKDVVRAIVHKRRKAGIQRNRLRPICVPSKATLE